jgi:hypothetical protein
MEWFPTIVARARTVQIIASGSSGHASGTLQLVGVKLPLQYRCSLDFRLLFEKLLC